MCINYEYLQCTLLHLHIYTGGLLNAWPMLTMRIDPSGKQTRYLYMCSIYTAFYTSEFLLTYYHYISLLLIKSPLGFLQLDTGELLNFSLTFFQITFPYTMAF